MAVNNILAFAFIASVFYLRSILRARFGGQVKAPVVGSRSPWEPYLLTRLRFTKNALHAINEGYTKVSVLVTDLAVTHSVRHTHDMAVQRFKVQNAEERY